MAVYCLRHWSYTIRAPDARSNLQSCASADGSEATWKACGRNAPRDKETKGCQVRSVEDFTAEAHDLALKIGKVLVDSGADHEDRFMALLAVIKALGLPPSAALRPGSTFYDRP